jgi:hypothetical protein
VEKRPLIDLLYNAQIQLEVVLDLPKMLFALLKRNFAAAQNGSGR